MIDFQAGSLGIGQRPCPISAIEPISGFGSPPDRVSGNTVPILRVAVVAALRLGRSCAVYDSVDIDLKREWLA
jgi:hypothetical protein